MIVRKTFPTNKIVVSLSFQDGVFVYYLASSICSFLILFYEYLSRGFCSMNLHGEWLYHIHL